jgi:N-acylneuraminate cytidylyltransferase
MRVLAVVPARGGSKGIPRKNLAEVAGTPLVVHSINHAMASRTINRVVVSTDDEEIRQISLAAGAEVPFLRPAELSRDDTLDLPVFEHALKYLESQDGYVPDVVVHLRPTAPLRKPAWIDEAVEMLVRCPDADLVRSVSQPDKHPYRVFRIGSDGFLDPIMKHEHPHPYLLRRQDLPPMYYYNCVIDVTRPRTIFGKSSMTGEKILPYVMSSEDSFDIDSARDLEIVRLFAKHFQ